MPIYVGTASLADIYVGNTPISKVYVGTTLVFDKGQPPVPSEPIYVIQNGTDWLGNTSWNQKLIGGSAMYQTTPMSHIYTQSNSTYSRTAILSQNAIAIPRGFTTLHVEARRGTYSISGYSFGMVPSTVTVDNIQFDSTTVCTSEGAFSHANITSGLTASNQTFDIDISGYDPSITYKFYVCVSKGGTARRYDYYTPTMWID